LLAMREYGEINMKLTPELWIIVKEELGCTFTWDPYEFKWVGIHMSDKIVTYTTAEKMHLGYTGITEKSDATRKIGWAKLTMCRSNK